jgi:hypothetical protein
MMDIDSGLTPELAVTAKFPSGLTVSPYGWGATSTEIPAGVSNLPFGITVMPLLLTAVYSVPAGADRTESPPSRWLQDTSNHAITVTGTST